MTRQAKWVVGVVAAVMTAALVVSAVFLVRRALYSAKVTVTVAPSTAVVTVGEEKFAAVGEYKVRPGEYAVEVSAEGFESKRGRLVVADGASVKVALFLEPLEGNEDWYDTHPEDALVMGEILARQRVQEVAEVLERAPVLERLPQTIEYFTEGRRAYVKYVISYELDASAAGYHLIVKDYTGGNEGAARVWIEGQGVDLGGEAAPEVVYEDLTGDRL